MQANCPLGCPCDNYDCDNNGSEDDDAININGPISIEENNFISKFDYSDNFEVSFEYKASTIPNSSSWHEILIGKLTLFVHKINQNAGAQ